MTFSFSRFLTRTHLTTRRAQLGVLLIVLLIVGGIRFFGDGRSVAEEKSTTTQRTVEVASVSELSSIASPLPLLGVVVSRSEAIVRAEGSGRIVGVYHRLGEYVSAGTVIAEFENATERALLLSAQGAYEAASAGKDIATISSGSSDRALAEARTQAQNVISSAYTTLDDAIRTKTDPAWNGPLTPNPLLVPTVPDAKLVIKLEGTRAAIEPLLRVRETKNRTLTDEHDLLAELSTVEAEVNMVKDYLDDLSLAFNRAIPDGNASLTAIEGYKANTGVARSTVSGTLSAITATRNALYASIAAQAIAAKNAGGSDDTSSASSAQVKSALGNLRAAEARLEKTIIRSPISGTLNSLSIHTGDFISPFTEVAVVSNNGALEVEVAVTEQDAKELAVGAPVTIGGAGKGVITRIAPALDPKTGKIEVRIGILKSSASLVNGQSVEVIALRAQKQVSSGEQIKIPLSALKITPSGSVVFTLSSSSTLIAHPVTQGRLLGDEITILDGVTPDMRIVTDARGLEEGMAVTISTP